MSALSNEVTSEPATPQIADAFRPALSFFHKFFKREASSSILLLAATIMALILANSYLSHAYYDLWNTKISIGIGKHNIIKSFSHWINDGLMTFFFFTVGLEIKRELLVGALASRKNALLPVIAAIGGMIFPGIVFIYFNHGTEAISGWAIPMATDIAFALGAIAVFGRKLPIGLRVFLTAFAIADDLGSVFIIALFYTKEIVWLYLIICIVLVGTIIIVNLLWIRWTPLYGLLGMGIWFSVLGSGVHPTVAGILVATLIPARAKCDTDQFARAVNERMAAFKYREKDSGDAILLSRDHINSVHALRLACDDVEPPLQHLEHSLHPWVAFVILPLFAFANAGLSLKGMDLTSAVFHPVTMGIVLGLFIGKPLGVALFAYLAVKTRLADLPEGVRWSHIVGAGMLGGIGFTMSLFISALSFTSPDLLDYSKLGILIGSLMSAVFGLLWLGTSLVVSKKSPSR